MDCVQVRGFVIDFELDNNGERRPNVGEYETVGENELDTDLECENVAEEENVRGKVVDNDGKSETVCVGDDDSLPLF